MEQYNQKRNFSRTAEPVGKTEKPNQKPLFVVQHHIASRDHYDFRLEHEGVLKSWAVPKGPSANPADKRLAILVEDHPMEYRHFEGTIPKGQYGGGTVMLWDEGTYEPLEFGENSIKFVLHGKRLKGKWALVRMKDKKDNSWLLMKEKDSGSKNTPGISRFAASVRTGRTMEQITAGEDIKSAENPFASADAQLAKLTKTVPEGEDWLFEIKYDGYRILSFIEAGKARLLTRNGNDYAKKFKAAAEALIEWAGGRAMVLDGEMVAADKDGRPDFQALQNYLRHPAEQQLQYMIFDILALDGEDLREAPLFRRKEILEGLLAGAPELLQYSVHINGNGTQLLEAAREKGLEGIVGKKADSAYAGTRSGDWVKIKCEARQEFIICGYTVSERRTYGISSFLLGIYRGGELSYCGRTSGFSERDMARFEQMFKPIIRKTPPFREAPKAKANETIVWLKPQFAAEVAFAEWTREGLLRQAKFKGLRTDKDISQITREEASEMDQSIVEGVKITHPDKLVSGNTTKMELALYYQKAAPRMLPYIQDRFISEVRCPDGAGGECFFKKHPQGDEKNNIRISNIAELITEVQMNTLEFHAWGSRTAQPEQPDVMVFDLDPDDGIGLEAVRQGAKDLKGILDGLSLRSYLKTSGGKGYHVAVPFEPSVNWEAFRDFSKGIVQMMEAKWPERYVSNARKDKRKGKVFVDWIRNTRGATSAVPYSVRKREGLPVSMPIAWGELDKIAPDGIGMAGALQRLRRKDPWEGFFQTGQRIKKQ